MEIFETQWCILVSCSLIKIFQLGPLQWNRHLHILIFQSIASGKLRLGIAKAEKAFGLFFFLQKKPLKRGPF